MGRESGAGGVENDLKAKREGKRHLGFVEGVIDRIETGGDKRAMEVAIYFSDPS